MRYLSVHKSFNFLIQRKSSFFRSRLDEGSLSTEHAAAESREKKSENEQNFPSSRALGRAKGMRCSFSRAASVHSQIHMKDFLQKKMKIMYENFMMSEKCARLFAEECFDRAQRPMKKENVYIFLLILLSAALKISTTFSCHQWKISVYIAAPSSFTRRACTDQPPRWSLGAHDHRLLCDANDDESCEHRKSD